MVAASEGYTLIVKNSTYIHITINRLDLIIYAKRYQNVNLYVMNAIPSPQSAARVLVVVSSEPSGTSSPGAVYPGVTCASSRRVKLSWGTVCPKQSVTDPQSESS